VILSLGIPPPSSSSRSPHSPLPALPYDLDSVLQEIVPLIVSKVSRLTPILFCIPLFTLPDGPDRPETQQGGHRVCLPCELLPLSPRHPKREWFKGRVLDEVCCLPLSLSLFSLLTILLPRSPGLQGLLEEIQCGGEIQAKESPAARSSANP
jgi:hypothetical protein